MNLAMALLLIAAFGLALWLLFVEYLPSKLGK